MQKILIDIQMSLCISLCGFVIVQEVTSLKDGRASPTQISGRIKRGDILVTINKKSIVGMPFVEMSKELHHLTFNRWERTKQRIRLRFIVGEGLSLLEKNTNMTKGQKLSQTLRNLPLAESDGKSLVDMFFPPELDIVDQLSGMPIFDNSPLKDIEDEKKESTEPIKQRSKSISNNIESII